MTIHCEDVLRDPHRIIQVYVEYLAAEGRPATLRMRQRLREEVASQTSKWLTIEVGGTSFHIPPNAEMFVTYADAINWIDMGEGSEGEGTKPHESR